MLTACVPQFSREPKRPWVRLEHGAITAILLSEFCGACRNLAEKESSAFADRLILNVLRIPLFAEIRRGRIDGKARRIQSRLVLQPFLRQGRRHHFSARTVRVPHDRESSHLQRDQAGIGDKQMNYPYQALFLDIGLAKERLETVLNSTCAVKQEARLTEAYQTKPFITGTKEDLNKSVYCAEAIRSFKEVWCRAGSRTPYMDSRFHCDYRLAALSDTIRRLWLILSRRLNAPLRTPFPGTSAARCSRTARR